MSTVLRRNNAHVCVSIVQLPSLPAAHEVISLSKWTTQKQSLSGYYAREKLSESDKVILCSPATSKQSLGQ